MTEAYYYRNCIESKIPSSDFMRNISRERLKRKPRKPCNQGAELQRKARPRGFARGHAQTFKKLSVTSHQF
jgi:hypothetical protein